jgi:hypothetical protein
MLLRNIRVRRLKRRLLNHAGKGGSAPATPDQRRAALWNPPKGKHPLGTPQTKAVPSLATLPNRTPVGVTPATMPRWTGSMVALPQCLPPFAFAGASGGRKFPTLPTRPDKCYDLP